MTTQAIELGGRAALRTGQRRHARSAVQGSLLATVRYAMAVAFLVLALCGLAVVTGVAADTTPREGPAPGMDL